MVEAVTADPDRDELKQDDPDIDDEDIRQALEFAAISLDDQILRLDVA